MAAVYSSETDRGWAWVVLISGLVTFSACSLTLNMYGVLYIALLDTYKEGESKTALVGALNNGFLCFFSPVSTFLLNRIGSRNTAILGAITTAGGFALSAVVSSLNAIIFTAGVAVGIGYSMVCTASVVSIGFYFKKYRNIAMSSVYLSVGTGMFGSTPLGLLCLETFGLSSTYLIMASITLQVLCVGAVLAKPSSQELDSHVVNRRSQNKRSCLRTLINVQHLHNVGFVLYLFSVTSWNFAFGIACLHLPNYLAVNGASNGRISLVFLMFAIANTAGRLCSTILSGRVALNLLLVNALALGINGIGTMTFFFYSDLQYGSEIFAIQLGFLAGIPNGTQMAVAVRFLELAHLPEAVSFVYFFSGIGVFLGPYIAGFIYGMTRAYSYSFITAGVVLMFGCLSACLAELVSRRKQSLKEIQDDVVQYDVNDDVKNGVKDDDAMLSLKERQVA